MEKVITQNLRNKKETIAESHGNTPGSWNDEY